MKFSEIKDKIKNNRGFNSIKEIKEKGLRVVRNTKTGDYWLIEEEYLKPVIKSLKEIKSLIINIETKLSCIFCNLPKNRIKNSYIIDYIVWGEKNKYNLHPTCKNRKIWYSINQIQGEFLFNMSTGDRYLLPWNKNNYFFDARLYGLKLKQINKIEKIIILLNTSYLPLFFEISGRIMTGSLPLLDLKVFELKWIYLLNPNLINEISNDTFNKIVNREVYDIFTELGFDPDKPIREQEPNPLPDRKALDDIVFDALGLTEDERKEVYYAVAELVHNRLKKAKSV